ncbi:MAG: hypothetical protein WBN66_06160, partial [Smithella sp.]
MIFREINIFKRITSVLTFFIVVIVSTRCYATTEILNVRHWTAPDHTRIVLDLDGTPDYDFK